METELSALRSALIKRKKMATYSVTQARNQQMTFAGSEDHVKITWHADYFVDVTLGVGESISDINAYDILTAPGIPIVNRTVYEVDNKFIPFVLCRNKSCRPHQDRYTRWTVSAQFESSIKNNSGEGDNTPISKPTALFDVSPRVVPVLGETQKVLYEDKSEEPLDCARTPANNWWNDPVIERIPTLALQITQYESYVSYEDLLKRSLKVNQSNYRGGEPGSWLIQSIQPTEVEVPLVSGTVKAAQVTYTVAYSPHEYGWKESRALIDSQYLEDPADKTSVKLFKNKEPGVRTIGFITNLGGRLADQTGSPEYIEYKKYDEIEFDDFLQI